MAYFCHSASLISASGPNNIGLVCLFNLILYVPVNNFFSFVGRGLPGLNQY